MDNGALQKLGLMLGWPAERYHYFGLHLHGQPAPGTGKPRGHIGLFTVRGLLVSFRSCSICKKKQNKHFIVPASRFKLLKVSVLSGAGGPCPGLQGAGSLLGLSGALLSLSPRFHASL